MRTAAYIRVLNEAGVDPKLSQSHGEAIETLLADDFVTREHLDTRIAEVKCEIAGVRSEIAGLGLPTHVRALVLNHSPESRGVTDVVCNRYAYDNEKRDALEKWEARLRQLVGLEPSSP